MSVGLIVMLLSFTILFILLLFRVNLALSMFISTFILIVFTVSLDVLLRVLFNVTFYLRILELALTVSLITIFGFYYQESGFLDGLVVGLESLVRDAKYVMMLVPAIFGLLPTLDGALLSASVVEIEGGRLNVDGCVKNFINLWFRHIVFLVYPIGVMMVLASLLTGVSVFDIVYYLFPSFFVALFVGYFLGVGGLRGVVLEGFSGAKFFIDFLSPLLASIIVAVLVRFAFGIAIAILIGILIILFSSGFRFSILLSAIWKSRFYGVALASVAIMLFREFLDVSGEIAVLSCVFPRIFVYTIVSFISGFLLGSPIGALAFSLSVTLALNGSLSAWIVSLVYAFTLFGYVVSPLHSCFILSSKYFKVKMINTYPRLLVAASITLLSVVVSVYFLSGFRLL